ncbi:T9SS type A sorting domain-containing protein [Hymenobacter rubidus]|uniref:T9SS type A sorting domain-containing protein n=1 Tax=Hymenobacter rubidus TaxID=1441626 RepID=UPI00191E34E5|nr:T9SS type A sorting domain-containing protein [Hymenobacter rubidus]
MNISFSAPNTGANGAFLNLAGGLTAPGGTTIANAFFIEAGSTLNFIASGNTNNRFIGLIIGTGQTALIAGNMTENVTSGTPNRFVAPSNASIQFASTSTFTSTSNSGNLFGTTGTATFTSTRVDYGGSTLPTFTDVTSTNTVTFTSGSTFIQQGGVDPFGPGTTPVTSFSSGSIYTYNGGTFSTIGRTYGNLEYAGGSNTSTVTGTQQFVVANDLTITSGTVNLGLTGTGTGTAAAVSLQGNLVTNGGVLNINPASTSTFAFNSPVAPATVAVAQSISGTATSTASLNFGTNALFEVNNPAGLTLSRPVTVTKGLVFTAGLVTTTATNVLTLPATASVTGGSDARYVNGPVARTTTSGASANMVFPVGKSGNYRPITLNITAQTNTGTVTYTGEQIETPPTQSVAFPLTRVSFKRYFTLAPNITPTGFNGTVTLSFGTDDFVNYPDDPAFVIARRDGTSAWASLGHGSNTGTATNGAPVAGTLTSTAFTSFPTTITGFSLGNTSTATFTANPLPVELTYFDATAKAQAVNLNWTTASEKNSDHFDIQRSADGETFETLATVKGQGNSTKVHEYTLVDSKPLAGLSYYRLRQVDIDGTSAFSQVAAVQALLAFDGAYPNPSAGTITLPATLGTVRYRLYNPIGQTLLSGQAAGNDRLDLTTLPKGPLFLELTGDAGRTTQRLIHE